MASRVTFSADVPVRQPLLNGESLLDPHRSSCRGLLLLLASAGALPTSWQQPLHPWLQGAARCRQMPCHN